MARRYWLFKSDPDTFGLDDLAAGPDQTTCWDGVRNYQARNLLRDEVQRGDGVLFHHSRSKPPAVVAVAKIVRAGYPDPTQFEPDEAGFDAGSSRDEPRWYAVDIRLERRLAREVGLPEMRNTPGLQNMMLLRKGSRLSIQPVAPAEWSIILRLGKTKRGGADT
jgi:predicted RNA-binding protein with PUA-like domain